MSLFEVPQANRGSPWPSVMSIDRANESVEIVSWTTAWWSESSHHRLSADFWSSTWNYLLVFKYGFHFSEFYISLFSIFFSNKPKMQKSATGPRKSSRRQTRSSLWSLPEFGVSQVAFYRWAPTKSQSNRRCRWRRNLEFFPRLFPISNIFFRKQLIGWIFGKFLFVRTSNPMLQSLDDGDVLGVPSRGYRFGSAGRSRGILKNNQIYLRTP